MRRWFPVVVVGVLLGRAPAGWTQGTAVCGNGVLEAPEECDDGNTASGDCCSALCRNENQPPDCRDATASIDELWPPNHKMVSVAIVGVTDPDGDAVTVRATAVAQDEPVDSTGDGTTCPDAVGVGLDQVRLRSERSGGGDGRFYHIAFQAADRCNAVCTGEVTVAVRHDQSPKKSPEDGGPLYDSTLGAPACEGDSCDPDDCVPDPDDIGPCRNVTVPPSVRAKLEKAKQALDQQKGKVGRRAARLLGKAAKRAAKAAKNGNLPPSCADALATAVAGARTCVLCSGDD